MNRLDLLKTNAAHAATIAGGKLVCKSSFIDAPSIDFDQRLVKGIISAATVDEEGEVVQCHRLNLDYFPHSTKCVYLDHDYVRYPTGVGVCRSLAVRGESLFAITYIQPTQIGDDLMVAIECGALRHFSIGARATDFGPPTTEEVLKYGAHSCNIRGGSLIEYSFTAMPANRTALIEAVSKSLIRRESAVAFGLDDTAARKFYPTRGPAEISRTMIDLGGDSYVEIMGEG